MSCVCFVTLVLKLWSLFRCYSTRFAFSSSIFGILFRNILNLIRICNWFNHSWIVLKMCLVTCSLFCLFMYIFQWSITPPSKLPNVTNLVVYSALCVCYWVRACTQFFAVYCLVSILDLPINCACMRAVWHKQMVFN